MARWLHFRTEDGASYALTSETQNLEVHGWRIRTQHDDGEVSYAFGNLAGALPLRVGQRVLIHSLDSSRMEADYFRTEPIAELLPEPTEL